mmetsp:Transcript_31948/g.69005  ORF Transcript_31948/g.69005 Transcript_31948/m.69005 type:complete len:599 (-) Transcript_31948:2146-3942(-)
MSKIRHRPKPAPEACVSIPTESPVPGVKIELAFLLVQAVKARRKFLSKSSSLAEADDAEKESLRHRMIQDLQSAAEDKKSAFLNELRRQVEYSSASSSKISSRRNTNASSNAPTHCLKFLLEVLSDGSNSVHLRRSSLALAREILEKSSDSRAFLASGRCLLDFVSVIEGIEYDQAEEEEGPGEASTNMSPKSIFQLEAMELIHHLASKFGRFYTQFTVASRLLGDVSVKFSMHNTAQTSTNNDEQEGGRNCSQRVNMKILRRERDIALECGPRACQSLGRMVERADVYFRILVPRFGGFNTDRFGMNQTNEKREATGEAERNTIDVYQGGDEDEGDDDSIDWEEGDTGVSDSENFNESTHNITSDFHSDEPNSHQAAVEQTMDIMGRAGGLLDGNLAVQLGGKSMEMEATPPRAKTETLVDLATTSQPADAQADARTKLQNMVRKFYAQRLPCLSRWIHALSHADGMEERAVIDPAMAGSPGNEGPVSLVLLSEEKRFMRSQVLQQLIKVRGEVQGVLRSASTLGISPDGAENKKDDNGSAGGAHGHAEREAPVKNGTGHAANDMKRPWMPGMDTLTVASTRKRPKTSRFKVIYRKK